MPAFKIASGDLNNTPLLSYVARFQKPMFVSTGGGTMDDVQRAYDTVMPINPRLCLMQCTASYPARFEELNIAVIREFRDRFQDIVIGFSSHDNGIAMPIAAYVLGARAVEKHFTFDRAAKGTDHPHSLERSGLRRLVRDLKNVRVALGDGNKVTYPSEVKPLYKMGKKLVAARDLIAGHRLTREDIAIKSPNDGLAPYELDRLIGSVLKKNISTDDNLTWEIVSKG
jgi:N-acetylneuraminate synthase/sialic acid synthase